MKIVQLFVRGARRRPEECRADVGLIGELRVQDNAGPNAERRPYRQADLIEPYGRLTRQMLAPLSDVIILRITPRGLLLRGAQVDSSSGTPVEHAQEWWCEPIVETADSASRTTPETIPPKTLHTSETP